MQYDVFVQGQLYTTITTDGGYKLNEITNQVNNAIDQGTLTVDSTKPLSVQVVPKN